MNRIIMKGLGGPIGSTQNYGLVTQGHGGFMPLMIVHALQNVSMHSHRGSIRSNKKKSAFDQLTEVVVWAKLIEINSRVPSIVIEGRDRHQLRRSSIAVIVERVGRVLKRLKVTASMIGK